MPIGLGLLLASLIAAQQANGQPPLPQPDDDANRNSLSPRIRTGVVPVRLQINELQAVNLARQHFAGTVLRISLVGELGQRRYEIRMENEGKVFTVTVDASNGKVSGGS